MTTEYKLNQLIKWTDKDRAKGKCPVPDGSVVTVWFSDGTTDHDCEPEEWNWGVDCNQITAYLIHSVPREPLTLWYVNAGDGPRCLFHDKEKADDWVNKQGGRVVKMVEEMK